MTLVFFKWKEQLSLGVYTIPERCCELVNYLMFALLLTVNLCLGSYSCEILPDTCTCYQG